MAVENRNQLYNLTRWYSVHIDKIPTPCLHGRHDETNGIDVDRLPVRFRSEIKMAGH